MLLTDPGPVGAPHVAARMLEVPDVAHRLSTCEEFVRRLIRSQQLPARRLGQRWRIDTQDLEKYIDVRRTHGPPR